MIYVWDGEVDSIQPGLEELWKLDPSFPLIRDRAYPIPHLRTITRETAGVLIA